VIDFGNSLVITQAST
jgi:hypothetical protein